VNIKAKNHKIVLYTFYSYLMMNVNVHTICLYTV